MNSPKGRKPLFERLKTGMIKAIRHARGEVPLKTTVVEVSDPPPNIQPEEGTGNRPGLLHPPRGARHPER
jgi:hypothetical protein